MPACLLSLPFEFSNLLHFCIFAQGPSDMKSTFLWVATTFAAGRVSGHATFQDLWVHGVDEICISFTSADAPLTRFLLPGNLCPFTTFKFACHGCDEHRY